MTGECTFYKFGDITVDLPNFRVLRSGLRVTLSPRAFDVLLLLIENRGRVIEKQEIFDAVWKNVIVGDNALTKAVKEIRQALGDDVSKPRFIETKPKRGYRFIGEVVEHRERSAFKGPAPAAAADHNRENIGPPNKIGHRSIVFERSILLSLAIILTLSLVGWYVFTPGASSDTSAINGHSLAILPFKNLTGDASNDYLCDGMTESLIASLSKNEHLTVVARNSSFAYKEKEIDLAEIGQKLSVETLVTGSIRKEAESFRADVRLVNAPDGRVIWTNNIYKPASEFFLLQDEIARSVAVRLKPQTVERASRHQTENQQAYELYLKGRYYWNKRTPDDLQKSVEYFDHAIAIDPQFALADAGLANSYQLLSEYRAIPVAEGFIKSRAAAEKALAIDGELAEAHTALAYIQSFYDWEFEKGEQSFRRAIELDPNYATAHQWYAELMMVQGRFDEALAQAEQAHRCDPLSPIIISDVASVYYMTRQYEKSLEQARQISEIDPNFLWGHVDLWANYLEMGRQREAYQEYSAAISMVYGKEAGDEALTAYNKGGATGFWKKYIERANTPKNNRYYFAWDRATAYMLLGDKDKTFYWLDKSYEQRERWIITIQHQPIFDPIRSDPRYNELVRRMGLPPEFISLLRKTDGFG